MKTDPVYEDLVVAMLAVNNLAVEKVYRLRDGLRQQGLFSPEVVTTWSHESACAALKAAGYDRGPYYGSILAGRLQELARFAVDGGLGKVVADFQAGHRKRVDEALLKVHGVGPAVMRNFWLLQES